MNNNLITFSLRVATAAASAADSESWLEKAYADLPLLSDLLQSKMQDKVATLLANIKTNVGRLKGEVLDKLEDCCSVTGMPASKQVNLLYNYPVSSAWERS